MSKNITAERMIASAWESIAESRKKEDVVPKGWHTSEYLAKALKKSRTRMGEILKAALDEGKCERREFRIKAAGTVRPVFHYRPL